MRDGYGDRNGLNRDRHGRHYQAADDVWRTPMGSVAPRPVRCEFVEVKNVRPDDWHWPGWGLVPPWG